MMRKVETKANSYIDPISVIAEALRNFRMKPKIPLSDWADENRRMSKNDAAVSRWKTSRVPCAKMPMDASCSHVWRRVSLVMPTQLSKTEVIVNSILYSIDRDPSGILMVFPDESLAVSFSKGRLTNSINATFGDGEVLYSTGEMTRARGSKAADNTIQRKLTNNGTEIDILSIRSKSTAISRPRKKVFADEVDMYPDSDRAIEDLYGRTQTFSDGKMVEAGAPNGEDSTIIKQYKKSYGFIWHIKCPKCKEMFAPEAEHLFLTSSGDARLRCGNVDCGHGLTDKMRRDANKKGEWMHDVATFANKESRHAGFRCNAFASPFISLQELMSEKLIGEKMLKDEDSDGALRAFYNNRMTQEYKARPPLEADVEKVMENLDSFSCDAIPDDVMFLSCAVDTQDNRLEYEIVGWSKELERRYGLGYHVVSAMSTKSAITSPADPELWKVLEGQIENRDYVRADGRVMKVSIVMVDSGGHYDRSVMRECLLRSRKNWIPIKGGSMETARTETPMAKTYRMWAIGYGKDPHHKPMIINTNFCKTSIFRKIMRDDGGWKWGRSAGYDQDYFYGLVESERPKKVKGRAGGVMITWEMSGKGIRNEPLDLAVYNYAGAVTYMQLMAGRYSEEMVDEMTFARMKLPLPVFDKKKEEG